MRILVTDGMDKKAMATLREMGHEVVEQFYEPDQLGAALKDFEGLVVNPEKGISEANRFVAPPSPAEAKAVCSSEKNSIIWLMR